MLNVDDDLYYKIRKCATEMHMPISTWVKLQLVQIINQEGNE